MSPRLLCLTAPRSPAPTSRARRGARRRDALGAGTYVLYIDFKQAYDRVSPAALEATLRRMGVPESMLTLLRLWRSSRTGTVSVNGERTAPFPMAAGVPQGCPLSPLLFSLFLASLSEYLDSVPGLSGVGFRGLILRRLAYADDVAILAETAAGLQLALDHIGRWSDAWGMTLSVGPSKTEAQYFPSSVEVELTRRLDTAAAALAAAQAARDAAAGAADRARQEDAPPSEQAAATAALGAADADLATATAAHAIAAIAAPPPLPTLFFKGQVVRWVVEYRYLGACVRSDLDDAATAKRLCTAAQMAYGATFARWALVRRLPLSSQLQLFRAHVYGASENLRGSAPFPGALISMKPTSAWETETA